jgi:hypothetical protein
MATLSQTRMNGVYSLASPPHESPADDLFYVFAGCPVAVRKIRE